MLGAFGPLGALLGLSWALLGALETPSGAILSDQRSLGDVSACFWEEIWSKDVHYVGFLVEFGPSEPRFSQYVTVFLKVFQYLRKLLL